MSCVRFAPLIYAIKIELEGGALHCVDIWNQTDPRGEGQCLDVDAYVSPTPGGCGFVVGMNKVHGKKWVITLQPGEYQFCKVI